MLNRFSRVRLAATVWAVTCQAPLSMGFSRQEYWSVLPFPSPGDLPDPPMQETWVQSLGWEEPLEKEMAAHSSILAWEIPRTEESGGLQSMGSQKSWTRFSIIVFQVKKLKS